MVTLNDAYSYGPRLFLTSVLPLRKFPSSLCYSRVGPLIIHSDRHLISPSPSASIPQSINMIKFLTFERTFPLDLAFPSSNHHQFPSVLTVHVHALYALCVWTLSLSVPPSPQALERITCPYSLFFLIFLSLLNKTSACLQLDFWLHQIRYRNSSGSEDHCPNFQMHLSSQLTHTWPTHQCKLLLATPSFIYLFFWPFFFLFHLLCWLLFILSAS